MKILKKILSFVFGDWILGEVDKTDELWKQFSETHDGNFDEDWFHHKNYASRRLEMVVPSGPFAIKFQESNSKHLKITSEVRKSTDFRFDMWTADYSDKIMSFFGSRDLLIGDRSLDKKFVFKSDQSSLLQQLFSDARLREMISSCEIYRMGATVTGDKIRLDCTPVKTLVRQDHFQHFYDLFGTMLTRMKELSIIGTDE